MWGFFLAGRSNFLNSLLDACFCVDCALEVLVGEFFYCQMEPCYLFPLVSSLYAELN